MSMVAPSGPVYQAGTLSGNPVAMAAGEATLAELERLAPWAELEQKGAQLEQGLADVLKDVTLTRVGSMGTAFFMQGDASSYADVKRADTAAFARFHRAMLERGVYLPPSQFEAWFLSTAHDAAAIDHVLGAAREAAPALAQKG
jgi:glutamate-1-semialdehyde 2,1-aminomutase